MEDILKWEVLCTDSQNTRIFIAREYKRVH